MASPIPILCRNNAGTGFLLTDVEDVWLVTCVHLLSGMKETPLIDTIFTGAEIRIVQTSSVIPLFLNNQQRFSVVINKTTGNLVDAIAIKLQPHEVTGLTSFNMFEIDSIKTTKVGETVTVSGFPGLGKNLGSGINAFEPVVVQYQVDNVQGLSIRLSTPGAVGLSGGPVVSELGLVGIMHGDVGDSATMTNALAISLDVVGEQLLR
ncbi:MAG: trypsin-like peptidase domain-containing protein [Gluconobacter oxydans]|uniref:trypsin-like peptidase domain-containing protein n=1 Tax=Gluconobacter oxydans TaxID=442 RepID=UPI0039EC30F7